MSVTKRIQEVVENISDVRCACDVKLPLADIPTISLCAILAGHEALDDISLYAEMNSDWLCQHPTDAFFASIIRPFWRCSGICQNLLVPRMILQPIIENAIEYGLRDVEMDGLLEVYFRESSGWSIIPSYCLTLQY